MSATIWSLFNRNFLVQFSDQLQSRIKQALGKRLAGIAFCGRKLLREKFEVLAVIENLEKLFVLPRPEEVRAKPRSAPNHLPEFGL